MLLFGNMGNMGISTSLSRRNALWSILTLPNKRGIQKQKQNQKQNHKQNQNKVSKHDNSKLIATRPSYYKYGFDDDGDDGGKNIRLSKSPLEMPPNVSKGEYVSQSGGFKLSTFVKDDGNAVSMRIHTEWFDPIDNMYKYDDIKRIYILSSDGTA